MQTPQLQDPDVADTPEAADALLPPSTNLPPARSAVNSARRRSVKAVPVMTARGSLFDLLASNQRGLLEGPAGPSTEWQLRLRLASRFVLDAMEGRLTPINRLHHSYRIPRILKSRWYRYPILLLATLYCLLVIWDPIPAAGAPADQLPLWSKIVEVVCLVAFVIDLILNGVAFGLRHFIDKKWDATLVVLVAWCVIDWLLYVCFGVTGWVRLSRMGRPFFIIAHKKSLRRLFAIIARTFPKMLDTAGIFFVVLCVFSVAGTVLFNHARVPVVPSGYFMDNDNFDNVGASTLAMFVFTTTENYPNVMYPALLARPLLAILYFVAGVFVFLWLILPLWLATAYDHYKEARAQQVAAERSKERKGLLMAYHILNDDPSKPLTFDHFESFLQVLTENSLSPYQARVMFDALDADRSECITVREFLELSNVLKLELQREAPVVAPSSAAIAVFCQKWLASRWNYVFQAAVVGNCILALMLDLDHITAAQDCVAQKGFDSCTSHEVIQEDRWALFFLIVQCVEMIVKVVAQGWKMFWRNPWNRNDLILVVVCTIAQFILVLPARFDIDPEWQDLLQFSQALRLIRIITIVPGFRHIWGTISTIMVITFRISVIYTCVTYSWAILGMYLLPDAPFDDDVSQQFDQAQVYSLRDFPMAMLTLLQLTIGNNWNTIMYPNLENYNRWYSFYFSTYIVIMSTVLGNIVTGVIIEAYCLSVDDERTQVDTPADPAMQPAAAPSDDHFSSYQAVSSAVETEYKPPMLGSLRVVREDQPGGSDEKEVFQVRRRRDWARDMVEELPSLSQAEVQQLGSYLDQVENKLFRARPSPIAEDQAEAL